MKVTAGLLVVVCPEKSGDEVNIPVESDSGGDQGCHQQPQREDGPEGGGGSL